MLESWLIYLCIVFLITGPVRAEGFWDFSAGENTGANEHWSYFFDGKFGIDRGDKACLAVGRYQSGSRIIIFKNGRGDSWIAITNPAWKSISPDSTYKIGFRFDTNGRRWSGNAIGIVTELGTGVVISTDKTFRKALAASGGLWFTYEGKEVDSFALKGSRVAMNAVEDCAKKYIKGDPFQGNYRNNYGDPFAKNDGTEYSIENKYKVQSTIAYGSRAGMQVSVIKAIGIGTKNAVIYLEHTRKDAKAFCVEYALNHSDSCIEGTLDEVRAMNLNYKLVRNCQTGKFTTIDGDVGKFEIDKTDASKDYILYRNGYRLEKTGADNYYALLDQARALCPIFTE